MKKRILLSAGLLALGLIATQSCKESNCGGGETRVSSFDSHESSRMKGNCMNCHGPNGGAEGCFNIGGSAVDSLTDSAANNAVVYLYSQPNGHGDLVTTLEVDRSGNFYTTSIINMGNGLYPAIAYKSGKNIYMPSPIFNGQCNSCHGITNPKIWVK